jgi:hypothetical protein
LTAVPRRGKDRLDAGVKLRLPFGRQARAGDQVPEYGAEVQVDDGQSDLIHPESNRRARH